MVEFSRNGGHDFNMASRKAEEAAWRRYEASQWLESQVGPLGISKQPTERELVSCLRSGLVLCNVINKIHPGAVPKVVDIPVASQPHSWDSQPLPAYQYFENVRNFLVATEELKIPSFEASDLERDSVDMGSASKVVECILSLKSFQELKQINNENDSNKQIKPPLQMHSASRMHSKATAAYPSDACRPLDLSATLEKTPPIESNFQQREDFDKLSLYSQMQLDDFILSTRRLYATENVESIVRLLADRMLDAKENINGNIHASLSNELLDSIKLFNQILSNGGGEQPPKKLSESGPSGGLCKDMGINYLALNDLFQLSKQRKDIIKYDIYVQMVEIYNEQVRDLLVEDKADNKVEIRSCNGDGLSLPDATLRSVKSTSDVLILMKLGEFNRAVSSTALNNRSSRSHSVLTVHVRGKDTSRSTIHSCLHLVDLAGSERVDKSEVTGDRLKEAQYINKSLSCLGDVITALAQKNSHIPYRNSKLTLLLQDSLGGHAKTLMFAHVSPEADSFSETMSTLKFAQRVSTVELGAARLNKETNEVMELKEQVEHLKIALANQEAQNAMFDRTKEPHPPLEEPALVSEKTQIHHRRRSIENCSALKIDKSVNPEDKSGTESSSFTPRSLVSEKTQFHHRRRSSIENCSAPKIDKSINPEDKSGTESSSFIPRSRRLSLEGPKSIKKDTVQSEVTADVSKTLQYESVSLQKHFSLQDPESVSKSAMSKFSNGNSRSELLAKAPSSPTSIIYQKRLIKIDSEVQIHPLKLPQTPELGRKDAGISAFDDLAAFCNDSKTTKVTGSTNGKRSHIRRSLRTIGKLIIGTDKWSQQHVAEVKSPINVTSHTNGVKTPPASTERTKRRHSLTGLEAPRPNSRRSSLEGNPVVPNARNRNARTPPPVRPTTKISARWA
ncbi:unnamed protein product [Lupinus luteus]|uniref:Uncharacterized protein n=1 Tax=Lupinus luteus TaxID=3873 RepID=A0AAV1Y0F9_LUPLU